jgi:hypothetical protein
LSYALTALLGTLGHQQGCPCACCRCTCAGLTIVDLIELHTCKKKEEESSLQRDPEGPSQPHVRPTPAEEEEESSLQRDPEGPSQPHVRPGTQSMSRLSNSKRHQPSVSKKKRVRYKETPRGPANPMFAPGPNPCPALVTQSATNLL